MDWIIFLCLNRTALIDGISRYVKHSAHDAFADGHLHWPTRILHLKSSLEAFGAGHGDRPDPFVAKMLLHLERQFHRLIGDLVFNRQRVVDAWQ